MIFINIKFNSKIMKKRSFVIATLASLVVLLGLASCKAKDNTPVNPEEEKTALVLSENAITLVPGKAVLVQVKSTTSWQTDMPVVAGTRTLAGAVAEKDWLRLDPCKGGAGVTYLTFSLVPEKLPAGESSIKVKFTTLKDNVEKTIEVKYAPVK